MIVETSQIKKSCNYLREKNDKQNEIGTHFIIDLLRKTFVNSLYIGTKFFVCSI